MKSIDYLPNIKDTEDIHCTREADSFTKADSLASSKWSHNLEPSRNTIKDVISNKEIDFNLFGAIFYELLIITNKIKVEIYRYEVLANTIDKVNKTLLLLPHEAMSDTDTLYNHEAMRVSDR